MVIYLIPKPLAKPTTKASAACLWYLPREIRDIIYESILSDAAAAGKSMAKPTPYTADRIWNIALLQAGDRIREEVLDFIVRRCTIEFVINGDSWSKFELTLLQTARRIRVRYDPWPHPHILRSLEDVIPQRTAKLDPLVNILRKRTDIDEFYFRGEGMKVLAHLQVQAEPNPPQRWRSSSTFNFRRIMKILEQLAGIRARRCLTVGWEGDETLQAHGGAEEDGTWRWSDKLQKDDRVNLEKYQMLLVRFKAGASS